MKRGTRKDTVAPEPPGSPAAAVPASLTRAALKRLRGNGDAAIDMPTPERLRHAGAAARVETFNRSVELHRGGRVVTDSVVAQRVRIDESPLSRLQSRGLLATGANAMARSAVAGAAGERYRLTWYAAGLQPLRSPDISLERVSGARGGLLRTERQVANFHAFGRAASAMAPDVRRVVDAVVLNERDPADIGRDLSGYRQEKQASAVALYLLRTGLAALAVHYGLMRGTPG